MAKIYLTNENIKKLKYINSKNLEPGNYTLPDFLIIGPQRTGTTWLSKNLVFNYQIFIPPEKELYFFSCLTRKENNIHFSSDRLEWYSNKLTPNIRSFIRENLQKLKAFKKISTLHLNYKKYCSPSSIGEATASYAAMDECLINEVKTLNHNIKAIMLIRHPLDRAWSHAKLHFTEVEKKNIDEVNFKEFTDFYTSGYQIRCGTYTEIINKWEKFVKKENFFIGFFDDISQKPYDLLARIFSFLDIPYDKKNIRNYVSESIINPTLLKEIPKSHKEFLFNLFDNEIQKLNKMFNLKW